MTTMRKTGLAVAIVVVVATVASAARNEDKKIEDAKAYLRISDQLATSGQIDYDEIPAIKKAGFDVVVNLAPARKERNGEEGFRVTEEGMTYIQIPVDWEKPSLRDLDLFFDIMKANQDRKVYVHCFANMRVSAFVYLYRTMELGVPEDQARADLNKIWDPATEPQWAQFIEQAKTTKVR
jgi:protein tyrosine phosphatase (PTP) superfamily phosphohydrolase (DUF442 family)